MANAVVRQNKLHKLVFDPEATLGTFEAPDASSLVIPAENVSFTPSRGTRIISRTSLLDGYAGDVSGAVGTWAWTLGFDCEVHDTDNVPNTLVPYWGKLLVGCGFKASDDLSSTITFSPTTTEIGNYSAGAVTNPAGMSISYLHNNNELSDTAHQARGCTGVATLNMTTGERFMMNFAFNGLVVDDELIKTDDPNISAFGSYAQLQGSPFVVKNMTCTFTDNLTAAAVTVVALNSLTINTGAETPDVTNACGSGDYGFAVSPVFWNSSPTVNFTIADTDSTDDYIFQRFFSGDTFNISVTLTAIGGSGNTIEVSLPSVQFEDVSLGEQNGYSTYTISGKAVRAVGDGTDDALMQIIYTYA
jgi:hypothetical protein